MFESELFSDLFRALVYASVGLTALQVYLTLNKLWKRKHEPEVAASVSILGEFVGLVPLVIMTVHFGLQGQVEGLLDGVLWVFAGSITVLVGTGFWVQGRRRQGLWTLLADAIRTERDEVGYLAKSFIRPSNARQLLDILGNVALLDADLDDRERDFIESFARAWHLDMDWASLTARQGRRTDPVDLRRSLERYLSTSPPLAQVVQLGDVLGALVSIDEEVSQEEALVMAEVNGMLASYAGAEEPRWGVVLVPQREEQEAAVRSLLPDVEPTRVRGGEAFLVGRHHSREYAEVVGSRFATLDVFVAVIRLDEAA